MGWNKSNHFSSKEAARGSILKVTKARSFTKSLSYRIFGTLSSFLVAYAITGKGSLSALIAIWETVVKVGIYYWHERIWDRIKWGRKDDKISLDS
jgi:uncharacterized membrane protein